MSKGGCCATVTRACGSLCALKERRDHINGHFSLLKATARINTI